MSRRLGLFSLLLAAACAEPAAPPAAPAAATENEPIRVTRGARSVPVSCQLDCAPLRGELERLSMGCLRDPLSTPHAVSSSPSTIGLGCCEEAASVYREACGDETLGSCTSEWLAVCQHAYAVSPASRMGS